MATRGTGRTVGKRKSVHCHRNSGNYKLDWWEQKDSLQHHSARYTLDRLRRFVDHLTNIHLKLYLLEDISYSLPEFKAKNDHQD